MAVPEMQAPQGQLAMRAGLFVQYAGAVISLALVAGVAVWGYKLLIRDMTGVPVVRAMEGPVREAPSNPGGEEVAHLGLSVNAVAAAGEAAPPEARLLLAPVQSELSEEDLLATPTAEADEPQGRLTPDQPLEAEMAVAAIVESPSPEVDPALLTMPAQTSDPAPEAANLPQDPTAPITTDPQAAEQLTAEQVLALADQIAAGAEPMAELAPGETVPPVTSLDGTEAPAILDPALPGLARALVPLARPANRAIAPEAFGAAEPVAEAAPALTTDIPVGTNLVQLGAYETPELAAEDWGRLAGQFAEFMTGKDRVIQQASSGGRTFFRLRAMGFADLGEARSFCAALSAEDAACIPVVVR